MFRNGFLATFSLMALAIVAGAAQNQPPPKDLYGDTLPPSAIARLGTVRFRHEGTIVFAAFLDNGKSVLSVGSDGSICVWEFPSGKEIHRFETHSAKERLTGSPARVKSASLSPDRKHLTVFCNDGFLRIWDLVNAKHLGKVANVVDSASPAETPGMSSLLDRLASTRGAQLSRAAVHSPDGKTLMLVGAAHVLQFVDLATAKEVGPSLGHIAPLTAVGFTPDGQRLWTKDTKTTRTWDATTAKELATLSMQLPSKMASLMVLSEDGRIGLAENFSPVPQGMKADLFDTATGKVLSEITVDADLNFGVTRPLLFSPNNQRLAISLGADLNAPNPRERIALYEVPSGKLLRTLDAGPTPPLAKKGFPAKGPKGFLRGLAQNLLFSADGKILAFQPKFGTAIVVFDTVTGTMIGALTANDGSTPALQGVFSPDGRCLALHLKDGTVALYELATGLPRRTYGSKASAIGPFDPSDDFPIFGGPRVAPLTKPGVGIALSPNGKFLALAGPAGTIAVLDVVTGKELALFKGHTGTVNALAFAPQGKTLASASADTTAFLWDVSKLKRTIVSAKAPPPSDLETWWQALAAENAAKAFAAMGDFVALPKMSVDFLKEQVQPAKPLDRKRIVALLVQLDAKQFKGRDKASRELLKMGDQLVPVLDQMLAANPSPETKQRLEQLRGKLTGFPLQGERLRVFRAVEVLEQIGTPEARQLLQALAAGEPGALVTTSAQAALKR